MSAPVNWFNDVNGIQEHLDSLENFQKLLTAREENKGKENEEFIVLGNFLLGSGAFNSFIKLLRPSPTDRFPLILDIVKLREFERWLGGRSVFNVYTLVDYILPTSSLVCAECGTRWSIRNCHNMRYLETEGVNFPIDKLWVGEKFADVKKFYLAPQESIIYRFSSRGWLYNPQKSRRPPAKPDDSYVIDDGDTLILNRRKIFHSECFKKNSIQEKTKELKTLFFTAGFKEVLLEIISKKSLANSEVAITWHVHLPFGALEVVENPKNTYRIDGRLCGINIWAMIDPSLDGNAIGGTTNEVAKTLHRFRLAMESRNRR